MPSRIWTIFPSDEFLSTSVPRRNSKPSSSVCYLRERSVSEFEIRSQIPGTMTCFPISPNELSTSLHPSILLEFHWRCCPTAIITAHTYYSYVWRSYQRGVNTQWTVSRIYNRNIDFIVVDFYRTTNKNLIRLLLLLNTTTTTTTVVWKSRQYESCGSSVVMVRQASSGSISYFVPSAYMVQACPL